MKIIGEILKQLDDLRRRVDALSRLDSLAPIKGTWTPTVTSSNGDATISFNTIQAEYWLFDDLLFYRANLTDAVITAAGTGDMRISLPEQVNGSRYEAAINLSGVDVPGTPVNLTFEPITGTTYGMLFATNDNAGRAAFPVTAVAAGESIFVTGFYKAQNATSYAAPTVLTLLTRTTLYTASGSDPWLGRSNLLELANGTWLHFYRSAAAHFSAGDGSLHVRFSTTQGASWTSEDVKLGGGAVTGFPIAGHSTYDATEGYPILAPNGDLLLLVREESTTAANGTYVWRSTDSGATWTDEGQINSVDTLLMGGQAAIVDGVIYITCWVMPNLDQTPPYYTKLLKSTDSGTTWTLVSAVSSTSEATGEEALLWLGGDSLLCILRHNSNTKTHMRQSDDLGATWGDITDIAGEIGVLQRPKLRRIGSRIYLHARDYLGGSNNDVIWYNDANGVAGYWQGPFNVNTSAQSDIAYGDLLERDDGDLYVLHYEGASAYDTSIIQTVLTVNR